MATTVTALFDHISQARAAVGDLIDNGYNRADINLVANAAADEYARYFDDEGRYRDDLVALDTTPGEGARKGAGIGAAVGGLGGLLMGIGLLAIPGVGPALAAGPIVSALVGAGIGAASGGLMGALVNSGVPEDDASTYAEGVRRGGTLVTLAVADDQVDAVEAILGRHDPVDIHERVERWRDAGWTDYDPTAAPYTVDQIHEERVRYGDGDRGVEAYQAAYRFGGMLARDRSLGDRPWADLEAEARRRWEETHSERWNDVREAVRHGYEAEMSYA